MDWESEIISVYLKISNHFEESLQYFCSRFSNNNSPDLSDEEIVTLYICGILEGKRTVKSIYNHAKRYWSDLFPSLSGYSAFNKRINKLESVFIALVELYQKELPHCIYDIKNFRLIDSIPIVLAKNSRRFSACVAPDIADASGYCAAKRMYYYGVKLHIMGSYTKGSMPIPEYIGLTNAGMNDGKAFEQIKDQVKEYTNFGDKAYPKSQQDNIYTPVKKAKGEKYLDAAEQLYSTAVSSIRQPIESLNNWIEEKTGIEIASKVRSTKGLLVHVFGRLDASFEILTRKLCVFNR